MRSEIPLPKGPERGDFEPSMVFVEKEIAWEYRQVKLDLAREELPSAEMLNQFGKDAWELSGVIAHEGELHLYFKRWTAG